MTFSEEYDKKAWDELEASLRKDASLNKYSRKFSKADSTKNSVISAIGFLLGVITVVVFFGTGLWEISWLGYILMFAASVRLYNSFNIIKSIGNINRERIDYNNTNHLFDRSSTVITPEQGRDLLSFKVKKNQHNIVSCFNTRIPGSGWYYTCLCCYYIFWYTGVASST